MLLTIGFTESPPRKRFYERVSHIQEGFAWKRSNIICEQVEEIQHFIAPGEAPPSMILNRTDDEDGLRLPSSTTRKFVLPVWSVEAIDAILGLFGYDGIILEATESGQVVAVMLF